MVFKGRIYFLSKSKKVSFFSKLKNLNICISIDGIGKQFEYIRYPLKWDTLLNNLKFFSALTGSGNFQMNSSETISARYFFTRIKNSEYNYTTNPSFISGSGTLVYSNFINSPQTYPTAVGLYNDNNELLAVAKMSKPLTKDFTKEALIRVKLDW